MSLELDEKDVRVVASRRFWAKRKRRTIGYFLLLMALALGLTVWLCKPWDYFALVPMLVAVGWFIKLCLGEKRAKKELVEKWREDV